jgi:hypothetical protein
MVSTSRFSNDKSVEGGSYVELVDETGSGNKGVTCARGLLELE